MKHSILLLAFAALSLSACSDKSSDPAPATPTPPVTPPAPVERTHTITLRYSARGIGQNAPTLPAPNPTIVVTYGLPATAPALVHTASDVSATSKDIALPVIKTVATGPRPRLTVRVTVPVVPVSSTTQGYVIETFIIVDGGTPRPWARYSSNGSDAADGKTFNEFTGEIEH